MREEVKTRGHKDSTNQRYGGGVPTDGRGSLGFEWRLFFEELELLQVVGLFYRSSSKQEVRCFLLVVRSRVGEVEG